MIEGGIIWQFVSDWISQLIQLLGCSGDDIKLQQRLSLKGNLLLGNYGDTKIFIAYIFFPSINCQNFHIDSNHLFKTCLKIKIYEKKIRFLVWTLQVLYSDCINFRLKFCLERNKSFETESFFTIDKSHVSRKYFAVKVSEILCVSFSLLKIKIVYANQYIFDVCGMLLMTQFLITFLKNGETKLFLRKL